jgi:hypothetical protein
VIRGQELLNVMAVNCTGKTLDGIEVCERLGVGVIEELAWLAAQTQERAVWLQ